MPGVHSMRAQLSGLYVVALLCLLASMCLPAEAYMSNIADKFGMRQTCSGMWAGKNTSVQVTFDPGARGLATVIIYEIKELEKIGKEDPKMQEYGQMTRTYICTQQAVDHKLCSPAQKGLFIVDESGGPALSVRQQRFQFGAGTRNVTTMTYPVNQTGYYCMGATSLATNADFSNGQVTSGQFSGHVEFRNSFKGHLPAAEYPKRSFYFVLTLMYISVLAGWLYLCFKYRSEIVTVQHFITGTLMFLIVEMFCQWLSYVYFNSHPVDFLRFKAVGGSAHVTAIARFMLVLTNVLDAAQNSISLFLLLIVSMGYGVVRPSIGPALNRVRILTAVHFVFGVLYSVGIVLILIESQGAWVFGMIIPLAITLTIFLVWTLRSLKDTIRDLTARRQSYKCAMFVRLYRILVGAMVAINLFFFLSTVLVAYNGAEELTSTSWQYRWIVLDGSLALLYFAVFTLIAWSWRPTGQNMRLAMSEELATDEDAEAGTYEVHTLGGEDDDEFDDDAQEVRSEHLRTMGSAPKTPPSYEAHVDEDEQPPGYKGGVMNDDVVFDIGEEPEEGRARREMFDEEGDDAERERLRLSEDRDRKDD